MSPSYVPPPAPSLVTPPPMVRSPTISRELIPPTQSFIQSVIDQGTDQSGQMEVTPSTNRQITPPEDVTRSSIILPSPRDATPPKEESSHFNQPVEPATASSYQHFSRTTETYEQYETYNHSYPHFPQTNGTNDPSAPASPLYPTPRTSEVVEPVFPTPPRTAEVYETSAAKSSYHQTIETSEHSYPADSDPHQAEPYEQFQQPATFSTAESFGPTEPYADQHVTHGPYDSPTLSYSDPLKNGAYGQHDSAPLYSSAEPYDPEYSDFAPTSESIDDYAGPPSNELSETPVLPYSSREPFDPSYTDFQRTQMNEHSSLSLTNEQYQTSVPAFSSGKPYDPTEVSYTAPHVTSEEQNFQEQQMHAAQIPNQFSPPTETVEEPWTRTSSSATGGPDQSSSATGGPDQTDDDQSGYNAMRRRCF